MKKIVTSYFIFLLLLGCKTQSFQSTSNDLKNDSMYVKLENLPSKDTSAIIFYKKNDWYIVAYSKVNLMQITSPQKCESCARVFEKKFFDSLISLENENNLSNDCTVYIDTVINGIKNRGINNFYNITSLQKETISVRYSSTTKSITFLEPRLALSYCKQNTARLNFIAISEVLRRLR